MLFYKQAGKASNGLPNTLYALNSNGERKPFNICKRFPTFTTKSLTDNVKHLMYSIDTIELVWS